MKETDYFSNVPAEPIGNIERDCPDLHLNEWLLLCDILNSTVRNPLLAEGLDLEVYDSAEDDAGAKWQVDTDSFTKRIQNMSHEERCAVIEVVEQFWNYPQRHSGENLSILKSVGARVCN